MRKLPLLIVIILAAVILAIYVISPEHKIKTIVLEGSLEQVEKASLNKVVEPFIGQSFWQVDLPVLHASLVRLDWVYKAQVARRWPDKIIVDVIEQKPVVRWGDNGLLNHVGEIFYPRNIEAFQNLVVLEGPSESAKSLLSHFQQFQSLLDPLGWHITKLFLQSDNVWKLEFDSGQFMLLNTESWEHKMNRFIRAFPKVKPDLRKFAHLYDLRYSNGFVIKQNKPKVISKQTAK